MMRLSFTLLILFSCSLFAEQPWIVKLNSEFKDESTNKIVDKFGSGFTLSSDQRYFIVTASHVSAGSNLKITSLGRWRSKELEVIGRLRDTLADIEILEVKEAVTPLIEAPRHIIETPTTNVLLSESLYVPSSQKTSFWNSLSAGSFEQRKGDLWYFDLLSHSIPVPGWIKHEPKYFDHFMNDAQPRFIADSTTSNTNDLSLEIPCKIVGGMSGLPMIYSREPLSGLHLTGVVTSYSRYTDKSYIAPAIAIIQLLRAYILENKRGSIDEFEWVLKNGNTYRKGENFSEWVDQSLTPAGGGEGADGGGGESADGGDSQGDSSTSAGSGLILNNHVVVGFKTPLSLVPIPANIDTYRQIINSASSYIPLLRKDEWVNTLNYKPLYSGESGGVNFLFAKTLQGFSLTLSSHHQGSIYIPFNLKGGIEDQGYQRFVKIKWNNEFWVLDVKGLFFPSESNHLKITLRFSGEELVRIRHEDTGVWYEARDIIALLSPTNPR